MNGVPWWAAMLSTLLAAVLPFIVASRWEPKGSKLSRRTDQRRAAFAIMRDKAEAIFREIEEIRTRVETILIEAGKRVASEQFHPVEFARFERLRALTSTYYPQLAPAVQDLVNIQANIASEFSAALVRERQSGQDNMISMQQRNHKLALTIIEKITPPLAAIERELTTIVSSYSPTAELDD